MKDLVVIGAGFWGHSTFIKARERGLNCLLVDSQEDLAASPNATGLVALSWYKKSSSLSKYLPEEWTYERIVQAFEWVKDFGNLDETGFVFYNGTTEEYKDKEGCYLLPEDSPLLDFSPYGEEELLFGEKVTKLSEVEGGLRVHFDGGAYVDAEKVMLAAGVWTDRILRASSMRQTMVECLLGRAFLVDVENKDLPEDRPLKVMSAPYQFTWIRPQYGGYRTGDSVEEIGCPEEVEFQTPLDQTKYESKFLDPVRDRAEEVEIQGIKQGIRPSTESVICDVWDDKGNLVVATGGGRVGLALSGIVSKTALELLFS